ncbi:hypothetical protein AAFC00_004747 [Neodothiora populina]|uniref:Uncharacterized protein n=1 Tax=Neodothiora populina TaxID=2781224 RepID=A0ABR3P4E5_9PEZI
MQKIDYLILGAGWTSTFLLPLLQSHNKTVIATSTTGRDSTLKFKFDPSDPSPSAAFATLPNARNILITFPLTGKHQSELLVNTYKATHARVAHSARFVQLGSSGIFTFAEQKDLWVTRRSAYDTSNARAVAEDELRGLGGCVLNLSGLWGGATRDPKNWVDRVATTKEQVRSKMSLHMNHGEDVARAIFAVFEKWSDKDCVGQRWLLTDGFVYCWWALMAGWAHANGGKDGEPSKQSKWVYELMIEQDIKALPRSMEALGRCYDTREFWQTFGISPVRSRI